MITFHFSEAFGVRVRRCYAGHLMTSLNMAGIQFSVLKIPGDKQYWFDLLDEPTNAQAWPKCVYTSSSFERFTPSYISDEGLRWTAYFEVRLSQKKDVVRHKINTRPP